MYWHFITKRYHHDFVVVQSLSHVQLFATPWTAACQASLSFTISWSLLKLMFDELVIPTNHLILCHPLLLLPSIFLSIRVFSDELTLWSGGQSIGVSASASVFQWIFRVNFLYDWLVWSPCSPRNSQESSLAQYEGTNSLTLSLLCGPTLISVHDYCENHRFDHMDLCWQTDISDIFNLFIFNWRIIALQYCVGF